MLDYCSGKDKNNLIITMKTRKNLHPIGWGFFLYVLYVEHFRCHEYETPARAWQQDSSLTFRVFILNYRELHVLTN